MKAGRNDPCPCGSGKKHKQCCLVASVAAAETPADLAWRRLRRASEGLVGRMVQFTLDTYGPEAIDEAWAEFMFGQAREDWKDSPHRSVFLPWLLHLWSPDPKETSILDESLYDVPPTQTYLERKGKQLDSTLRRYLEECLVTPFAFHEVIDITAGHGFRVKELMTGEEHEVLERSGSQTLQKGDVLFASLVHCDGIVVMEGAAPQVIPPIRKLPILEFRDEVTKRPDLFSNDLLVEYNIGLRVLYVDIMESILNPPLPELRNTDGDELSLQRLLFDIDSAQEAFDALKHLALDATDEELLAGAEYAADGGLLRIEFPWLKRGNRVHKGGGNTALGMIEINRGRLWVHVNSEQRAGKFKRIVSRTLRKRARYRATEIQSVQRMLAEAQDAGAESEMSADENELDSPEVKAQLLEMMSRYYDGWLNEKIPALRGKTPLQAAKTPQGREMVGALLSQFERDGQRQTPPIDASIFRRLRERLGLGDQ